MSHGVGFKRCCLEILTKNAKTIDTNDINGILQAPAIIIARDKKPNESTSPVREVLLYMKIVPAKPAFAAELIMPTHWYLISLIP